ncbi:MAG TPA: YegS/Rv2252/BmrU family lipid kinase [Gemmatimonadaceae bacterium]|nr:YegS/Rv2252/BmrU family lipid kinase [Gemmatimonadaceae bacterium]
MSLLDAPARPTIALVIHGTRAADPTLREAVEAVRARGVRVRPRVTYERGDAATFAREEADAGVDAVVAVGGDGTLNEVLNGLAGRDVPLGIVPLGTANDFARQAGIPEDARHALDLILTRAPVRLDTAELNGRRYLNVSSGGIAAEATADTSDAAKATLGALAYVLTAVRKLARLDAHRLQLSGPGLDFAGEAVVFFVGNARSSGGGMPVTPLASPNDGLLDVCLVEPLPPAELARLALRVRRGEHVGEPGVRYWRVPQLTIRSDRPLTVNVDGEPVTADALHYAARHGDLRIFLPEGARDELSGQPPEARVPRPAGA